MKNNRSIYLPLIFAIILIAGILIGSFFNKPEVQERLLIYPRTDKLNTILNYIEQKYVDSISKKELTEDVIPAIIENLDPHSAYIPAKEFDKYNEPLVGNFSGIGVLFNMIKDTVIIVRTIQKGPSEKVGMKAGDRIVKVDGEIVAGVKMQTDTVVSKLRGERGSKVNVSVFRPDSKEEIDFDIIRGDIPLYSIDVSYMITDSIGYMKISNFSSTTFEEFLVGINKLRIQGIHKLIIDLRSNGGGIMSGAIGIADQFLEPNKLIVYTEGRTSPRRNFYSTNDGSCLDLDVAIILDEWSASASEILAGAIQDNDRGIIIGRRSFGKGFVQDQTEFSDGSALRLTIARYYTPTGRCIQKPYENGNDDYYKDINNRYEHGEFYNADSIAFNDSLRFVTPGGNIVYGGGGIMPDIFIPADTSEITEYFAHIRNRGLIYRFGFDYTDRNRNELMKNVETLDALLNYLDNQRIVDKFIKYAKDKGVMPDWTDIKISRNLIEVNVKAEIARNIFDNDGYYPVIKEIDNTLLKAVKEISK